MCIVVLLCFILSFLCAASLVIPFTIAIFGNVISKMLGYLYVSIVYVSSRIVVYVVLPMHKIGVFEVLSWCVSILLVMDGLAATPQANLGDSSAYLRAWTGFYYAMTGVAGIGLSTYYSARLFLEPSGSEWGKKTFVMIGYAYLIDLIVPLMAHFQSSLLAFVLVGVLYANIGFFILVVPGIICIGFSGDDAMTVSILTSIVLNLGIVGLRVAQSLYPLSIAPALVFLSPALMPASVVATLALDVAMLGISRHWHYKSKGIWALPFAARNAMALAVFGSGIFLGSVFAIPGLMNTSVTFLILWGLEKYHAITSGNIIFFLFPLFVGLYFAAMWLHRHPDIVTSLFTWSFVEVNQE